MAIVKRVRDFKEGTEFFHKTPIPNPFLFQATSAGHFYFGKKHFLEREKENVYEMRFNVKGSAKIKYNNKVLSLKPNQLAILSHSKTISTWNDEDNEAYSIYFIGPYVDDYVRAILEDYEYPLIDNFDKDLLIDTINRILSLYKKPQSLKEISLLIYSLLLDLVKRNYKITASQEVIELKTYMKNHYRENITLDSLAEFIGYNKFYIIKKFVKEEGTTPIEYLNNVRFNMGLQMLLNTNLNITQIAKTVGFQDRRSFVSVFKKRTGTIPKDYKKDFVENIDY